MCCLNHSIYWLGLGAGGKSLYSHTMGMSNLEAARCSASKHWTHHLQMGRMGKTMILRAKNVIFYSPEFIMIKQKLNFAYFLKNKMCSQYARKYGNSS